LIIGDITAAGERMTFRAGTVTVGNIARGEVTADMLIPDDQPAGIQSPMTISERGQVKSIKARVSLMHTYIGDLQVELIAPSGKRTMLHDRTGAGADDLTQIWDSASLLALAALLGESIQGTWTLAIRDLDRRDTGRLNWWGLEIDYGSPDRVVEEGAQPNVAIPDACPQGVQSSIAIDAIGAATDFKVSVDISHTYQGDLLVELVAPSGRSATLHNRSGGSRDDLRVTYNVSSAPALAGLIGEAIQGNWMLRVRDLVAVDTGRLEKWGLTLSY
jgi:subtilisin-like proprotein convertase family protein